MTSPYAGAIRTGLAALRIVVVMLTLAAPGGMADATGDATGSATPVPTHESPKSPTGNRGTTALIATIATALVCAGIVAGDRVERRNRCAIRSCAITDGTAATTKGNDT